MNYAPALFCAVGRFWVETVGLSGTRLEIAFLLDGSIWTRLSRGRSRRVALFAFDGALRLVIGVVAIAYAVVGLLVTYPVGVESIDHRGFLFAVQLIECVDVCVDGVSVGSVLEGR